MFTSYRDFIRYVKAHHADRFDLKVRFHKYGPVPAVVHKVSCRHGWAAWNDWRRFRSLPRLRRAIERHAVSRRLYLRAINLTPGCCKGVLG